MLRMGESQVYDAVQNIGTIDYIDADGVLHIEEKQSFVMVRNQDDLALLSSYSAGTVAYTAGMTAVWQKGADGEWEEM